jgi:hypothetical protein
LDQINPSDPSQALDAPKLDELHQKVTEMEMEVTQASNIFLPSYDVAKYIGVRGLWFIM